MRLWVFTSLRSQSISFSCCWRNVCRIFLLRFSQISVDKLQSMEPLLWKALTYLKNVNILQTEWNEHICIIGISWLHILYEKSACNVHIYFTVSSKNITHIINQRLSVYYPIRYQNYYIFLIRGYPYIIPHVIQNYYIFF